MVKFSISNTDPSMLRIDTTFNLYDLWVIDCIYKYERIANSATGNHLVCLYPLIFNFTKPPLPDLF